MCMRMKADQFTMTQLKQLHQQIVSFKKVSKPGDKQIKNVAKKFRNYCEMIIWGDKFNQDFVDFFCEMKSLEIMIDIFVAVKDKIILTAIIEGVSMLLINLSRQQSINYFLSNNAMMKFQMMKFSNLDTQLAEYYINFLKSVSIRLNPITVKLFYNQKYSNFPLLWQAIKFYNHPQTLIRNTSKNIILSVAKIQDQQVQKYLSSFPFIIYYSHLAYFIFDLAYKIDKLMNQQQLNMIKLNQYYDQMYDVIIYFEDLLSTLKDNAKNRVLNAYMQGVIVFMNYSIFSEFRTFFSPKMGLLFFSIFMRQGGNKELMNMVMMMLMGRYLQKDFVTKLQQIQSISRLKSHNKKWGFHGFWDDFIPQLTQITRKRFINQQFETQLIMSESVNLLAQTFCFQSTSVTPKSTMSKQEIQMTFSKNLAQSEMISQYATKDTQRQYISSPTLSPIQSEMSKLQKIHSIKINPNSVYNQSLSILQISKLFHSDLQYTSMINLDEMQENHTKRIILGYLNSGDEHLILLVVDFLRGILKNKVIEKDILSFSGLNLEKTIDYYNLETIGRIMNSCFQIFKMGGLIYNIAIYKKVLDLIECLCQKQHILEIHKNSINQLVVEYVKNVIILFKSQISTLNKITSYQIAQKQSRKSITGLTFLQLISSPQTLTSQDKYITVCILFKYLKSRLFHKPINMSRIISIKSTYTLAQQIKVTSNMVTCQLLNLSQKSKKCYCFIQNFHLILVQKSNSKIFFDFDINKLSLIRDVSVSKRNTLIVKQNNTKHINLKIVYDNEKTALKSYNQFQSIKNQRIQIAVNQILNELQDYYESLLQQMKQNTNQ